MKIGLLSHQYPGVRGGGVGTYTLEAALALAGAGHEVHVFTFGVPAELLAGLPANLHVHPCADLAARVNEGTVPGPLGAAVEAGGEAVYRLALGWLLCEEARAYHRAAGLDVVEGPEYEALALPLMLHPEADLPVVTHLHLCSAIGRAGNGAAAGAADQLIDALEFAAIALADGRCAPTDNIVRETRALVGVPDATVFPHPMALAETCTPPPADGPILFVGRLEPRKGTELMAGAFNAFLARNPNARIELVGSDTQWPAGQSVRQRLERELDEAVRERVAFLGEQPPAAVREAFARCAFSICPSLFESFAYVAAESLIAGRPVVVSSDIGATDVVGEAGIVFPRGDAAALAAAMERLHRDKALLAQLGATAFARAGALLSRANTVERRVAFYRDVAEGVRHRGRLPVVERLARCLTAGQMAPLLPSLVALTGCLAGAAAATPLTPGVRLLKLFEAIGGGGPAEVLLFGAGRHSARLLAQRHLWEAKGHRVVGLIDDHPRFAAGATHLGLPVAGTAAYFARAAAGERMPAVVLSTDTFEDQFWKQTEALRALGVQVYRLYGK